MAIDPVHTSGAGAAQSGAAEARASQQPTPDAARNSARAATSPTDPGDTLQVSAASLALQAQAASPPAGTISAERLQMVLGRVMSGYYDQGMPRDAVARGVARDLSSGDEPQ
jgi:hypothetical protein